MRFSIRLQLLLPLFLLLLGIVGISTWTGFDSAVRAQRQIEDNMRNVGRTLSGLPDFWLNKAILEHMKRLTGADFHLVEVVPSDRTQVASTLPPVSTADLKLPPAVDDWQQLHLGEPVTVAGQTYLCSGLHLRYGTLYIFYPEQLRDDALREAVRPSLVLGLFGGVASTILAVAVAQRLGRRVQELERRTRLIAAGDFSPMPLPQRNDELRDLSRSVNDMAAQLAQMQETIKQSERLRLLGQVGGGLAHQLRNNVTGARLALQVHAKECAGRVETEGLDVALRQLALMEANLKRFLDLGRSDAGRREPCAIGKLIGESVALLRPQCRHARTVLRWQPPAEDVTIVGDAGQLGHLFVNIIGNAVEAAGPDGWVEVQLRIADCGLRIDVSDSGPGPPAEIAGRLFQPFVTGKPEGIGLGLAVAKQVVEAHGGRIDWQREGDRTCFRIELPLEKGPQSNTVQHQSENSG